MNLSIFFIIIFSAINQVASIIYPVTPKAACVEKDKCLTYSQPGYTVIIQGDHDCYYYEYRCVA